MLKAEAQRRGACCRAGQCSGAEKGRTWSHERSTASCSAWRSTCHTPLPQPRPSARTRPLQPFLHNGRRHLEHNGGGTRRTGAHTQRRRPMRGDTTAQSAHAHARAHGAHAPLAQQRLADHTGRAHLSHWPQPASFSADCTYKYLQRPVVRAPHARYSHTNTQAGAHTPRRPHAQRPRLQRLCVN